MSHRLYLVVRSDLPPGLQCAQVVHAARAFQAEHPGVEGAWFTSSNTVAVVAVPDEAALLRLVDKADAQGLLHSLFREPDLADSLTAVALEPSLTAQRLCRRLPLALAQR